MLIEFNGNHWIQWPCGKSSRRLKLRDKVNWIQRVSSLDKYLACYSHRLLSNWIQSLCLIGLNGCYFIFYFRRMLLNKVWLICVNAKLHDSHALIRHNLNISKTFERITLANLFKTYIPSVLMLSKQYLNIITPSLSSPDHNELNLW